MVGGARLEEIGDRQVVGLAWFSYWQFGRFHQRSVLETTAVGKEKLPLLIQLLVVIHCVFLVSMDLKIFNINDELLNGMDVVLVHIGLPAHHVISAPELCGRYRLPADCWTIMAIELNRFCYTLHDFSCISFKGCRKGCRKICSNIFPKGVQSLKKIFLRHVVGWRHGCWSWLRCRNMVVVVDSFNVVVVYIDSEIVSSTLHSSIGEEIKDIWSQSRIESTVIWILIGIIHNFKWSKSSDWDWLLILLTSFPISCVSRVFLVFTASICSFASSFFFFDVCSLLQLSVWAVLYLLSSWWWWWWWWQKHEEVVFFFHTDIVSFW